MSAHETAVAIAAVIIILALTTGCDAYVGGMMKRLLFKASQHRGEDVCVEIYEPEELRGTACLRYEPE